MGFILKLFVIKREFIGHGKVLLLLSLIHPSSQNHCKNVICKAKEADAITLDGGDIYTAGLNNYNLAPIIAEDYGTGELTN